MNKNIIIAILVVIIIAAGAAIMFGQSTGKTDTQINFLNKDTIQNGEQLKFELKDKQGNAISGQTLNINFNNQQYSVTTDSSGMAYVFISGVSDGKYDVNVSFAGNDKYNGCDGKFNIEVTSDAPDNVATVTTGSSVVSTGTNQGNQSENKTPNNNTTNNITDVYIIPRYGLTVRASTNTVIGAPEDVGIGLSVDEWIQVYGGADFSLPLDDPQNPKYDPDHPFPGDLDTNDANG